MANTLKVTRKILENIVEKSIGLPTPAMIVIGEVVTLRDKIKWFN